MRLHLSVWIPLILLLIIIFYPPPIRYNLPETKAFTSEKVYKKLENKELLVKTHKPKISEKPHKLNPEHLETTEKSAFTNLFKYDNGKISVIILPWGEMTETAAALGFQVNIEF